jgi:hypothetical protein
LKDEKIPFDRNSDQPWASRYHTHPSREGPTAAVEEGIAKPPFVHHLEIDDQMTLLLIK